MLHTLCVVQTVSLNKLISLIPTHVELVLNPHHSKRFIANFTLSLDIVPRMIFSLFSVKDSLLLSMDTPLFEKQ